MIDHPQKESEQRDSDLIFKKSNQTCINCTKQSRIKSDFETWIKFNFKQTTHTEPNQTAQHIQYVSITSYLSKL